MAFRNAGRLALGAICATVLACTEVAAPASDFDGTYVLESASGRGPASGTLILTRGGYAERRVRFREGNGTLSKEYLARGTATVRADNTIDLELREMEGTRTELWKPATRLVNGKVEIRHPDPADGPEIVEAYRRQ